MSSVPATPWIVPVLAFVLSAAALAMLSRARQRMPHDHPSGRSLHDRATGMAMLRTR